MFRLCYFLFFVSFFGFSQNIEARFIDSLEIECDIYFGKDVLEYDYFSQKNVLYKQKKTAKTEYKNVSLGEIHSIDYINPLRVLLFYKDFNSVVLLDNQLSEIIHINFSDFNIIAQNCSTASQNRLWIYDALSSSLLLFDYINKKTVLLNQPFKNTFKHCQSDYNKWYIVSEKNEIFSYDNYGKVLFCGIIPYQFDKITIINPEKVIFSLNNNLYLYQTDEKDARLLISDKKNIKKLNYKNGTMSIFIEKTLENYTIKLP